MRIFERVWEMVQEKVNTSIAIEEIKQAEQVKKLKLLSELDQAKTPEELDEVLERIIDSRNVG